MVLVPVGRLLAVFEVASVVALGFEALPLRTGGAPAATSETTTEIRFVDVDQGDGVVMRVG